MMPRSHHRRENSIYDEQNRSRDFDWSIINYSLPTWRTFYNDESFIAETSRRDTSIEVRVWRIVPWSVRDVKSYWSYISPPIIPSS